MKTLLGLFTVLLLSLMPLSAFAQADTSVTGFRNNPGHTGYTPATVKLPLSLKWRYTSVPAPNSPASPIYSHGVVYFGDGGHVYALHAADGSLFWKYPKTGAITGGTFDSTPTLKGSALYIGSDDANLYKLDAQTGTLVWKSLVGGAIRGAPALKNGIVYFGSADNRCYAASTATGSILWSFTTGGAITTTPVLSNSAVYFGSADDSIYCFTLKTGRKKWSSAFSSDPTTAPPAYAKGTLYVAASDTLYAMDGHTGQPKWQQQLSQDIISPPTIGPNFIAVGTVDGNMTVFDHRGQLLWQDALGYPSDGDPLLTPDTLFVPCQNGIIYALQSRTGKLEWEYDVTASLTKKEARPASTNIASAPIIADGVFYVLSDDGTLSALQAGVLDTLPPVVTDMFPAPGSTVPGVDVYPTAIITDNGCGVNPTTVTMTLDGAALPDMVYAAALRKVSEDTASANAPVPPQLSNGPHEIVVKATDWLGHTVTQPWGFFVDNKYDPQTTIVTP